LVYAYSAEIGLSDGGGFPTPPGAEAPALPLGLGLAQLRSRLLRRQIVMLGPGSRAGTDGTRNKTCWWP
jgi:hypothetical protein